MNKEKNFISAVVYVHNDEDHIGGFVSDLAQLLDNNFENSEIICVNDCSTDSSTAKIKEVVSDAGNVALTILNLSSFYGLEIAMGAGMDLSIGDYVLEIDNTVRDYDMDEIMTVYHKVLDGYDIVSASSDRKQLFSSTLFYWLYEKFSDDHTKLQTESFRILSRRAINRVESMSKIIPYRKGLYASSGLKTYNIQYHSLDTNGQRTDRNTRKFRQNLAIDTLIIFTNAGYACAKAMTFIMMIVSALMLIYTVVIYITANPVAGWTTTLLFLAFAFCGLFAILTIVIKYLQILLDLTFKRVTYNFESIEKLTK